MAMVYRVLSTATMPPAISYASSMYSEITTTNHFQPLLVPTECDASYTEMYDSGDDKAKRQEAKHSNNNHNTAPEPVIATGRNLDRPPLIEKPTLNFQNRSQYRDTTADSIAVHSPTIIKSGPSADSTFSTYSSKSPKDSQSDGTPTAVLTQQNLQISASSPLPPPPPPPFLRRPTPAEMLRMYEGRHAVTKKISLGMHSYDLASPPPYNLAVQSVAVVSSGRGKDVVSKEGRTMDAGSENGSWTDDSSDGDRKAVSALTQTSQSAPPPPPPPPPSKRIPQAPPLPPLGWRPPRESGSEISLSAMGTPNLHSEIPVTATAPMWPMQQQRTQLAQQQFFQPIQQPYYCHMPLPEPSLGAPARRPPTPPPQPPLGWKPPRDRASEIILAAPSRSGRHPRSEVADSFPAHQSPFRRQQQQERQQNHQTAPVLVSRESAPQSGRPPTPPPLPPQGWVPPRDWTPEPFSSLRNTSNSQSVSTTVELPTLPAMQPRQQQHQGTPKFNPQTNPQPLAVQQSSRPRAPPPRPPVRIFPRPNNAPMPHQCILPSSTSEIAAARAAVAAATLPEVNSRLPPQPAPRPSHSFSSSSSGSSRQPRRWEVVVVRPPVK
ncbi:MAG: hypothetical protein JOS17DRAFT_478946 [Linnemannia elongata]|nr:MAG: hypothetical protein JOS17DRAFT_478946 [Linnemannia elongata]